jgi:hypothetical protein
MLSQNEIAQQQQILQSHRRTLALYLGQQGLLGAAHISPGIANGIQEARDNIRRIKAILQEQGILVADHPDDEPPCWALSGDLYSPRHQQHG